jgi:transposase
LIEIEPVLIMLKSLNEQIELADEELAEIVKDDEVVERLTSVPGVGPVTATTYAATLDGAARFQDAKRGAHTSARCRASTVQARSSIVDGAVKQVTVEPGRYWSKRRGRP